MLPLTANIAVCQFEEIEHAIWEALDKGDLMDVLGRKYPELKKLIHKSTKAAKDVQQAARRYKGVLKVVTLWKSGKDQHILVEWAQELMMEGEKVTESADRSAAGNALVPAPLASAHADNAEMRARSWISTREVVPTVAKGNDTREVGAVGIMSLIEVADDVPDDDVEMREVNVPPLSNTTVTRQLKMGQAKVAVLSNRGPLLSQASPSHPPPAKPRPNAREEKEHKLTGRVTERETRHAAARARAAVIQGKEVAGSSALSQPAQVKKVPTCQHAVKIAAEPSTLAATTMVKGKVIKLQTKPVTNPQWLPSPSGEYWNPACEVCQRTSTQCEKKAHGGVCVSCARKKVRCSLVGHNPKNPRNVPLKEKRLRPKHDVIWTEEWQRQEEEWKREAEKLRKKMKKRHQEYVELSDALSAKSPDENRPPKSKQPALQATTLVIVSPPRPGQQAQTSDLVIEIPASAAGIPSSAKPAAAPMLNLPSWMPRMPVPMPMPLDVGPSLLPPPSRATGMPALTERHLNQPAKYEAMLSRAFKIKHVDAMESLEYLEGRIEVLTTRLTEVVDRGGTTMKVTQVNIGRCMKILEEQVSQLEAWVTDISEFLGINAKADLAPSLERASEALPPSSSHVESFNDRPPPEPTSAPLPLPSLTAPNLSGGSTSASSGHSAMPAQPLLGYHEESGKCAGNASMVLLPPVELQSAKQLLATPQRSMPNEIVPLNPPPTAAISNLSFLLPKHMQMWPVLPAFSPMAGTACDQLQIKITAKLARDAFITWTARAQGVIPELQDTSAENTCIPFLPENFANALVDWIVSDDQSINVIENLKLRTLFLMLLHALWEENLDSLSMSMKNALGKISFTTDIWTDPIMSPFLAITAHWIETKTTLTPNGPHHKLYLRADLAGFLYLPGHHTGKHIANAFLSVLDRLDIALKIGSITLNNASNNDTFLTSLKASLGSWGILFDNMKQRIRCFPHVTNLACKAVLSGISKAQYHTDPDVHRTWFDRLTTDPINKLQNLIRQIRSSSLHRQHFSEICQTLYKKDIQLMHDVDTRWSSTLYMIERAIILRSVIKQFLEIPEFGDLKVHAITDTEWKSLEVFAEILSVPHAFQHCLSGEKTPILSEAIPAFEAMSYKWKQQQASYPEVASIIQAGIDKLAVYQQRAETVPAYIVSMVLSPSMKLGHFYKNRPHEVPFARETFMKEMRPYYSLMSHSHLPRAPGARSPVTPGTSGRSWADDILSLGAVTPVRTTAGYASLEAEVEAYLCKPPRTVTKIIDYWQDNQLRYPTLFAAALDFLPIQSSAVPCERVFSSAKETMTDRRNKISRSLMEELQMLKFRSRRTPLLNFTRSLNKNEELALLEALNNDEIQIPRELPQFSHDGSIHHGYLKQDESPGPEIRDNFAVPIETQWQTRSIRKTVDDHHSVIGVALDLMLLGILTAQFTFYYSAFPNDRTANKTAVLLLCTLGVAQTMLAVYDLYLQVQVVTPRTLSKVDCRLISPTAHFAFTMVLSSSLVATITQVLYAHRIHIISRNIWLPAVILFVRQLVLDSLSTLMIGQLSVIQLLFGLLGTACDQLMTSTKDVKIALFCLEEAEYFGWGWAPANLSCDLTIAISMTVLVSPATD
ncbi:hypothetical protein NP233_g2975 [Leucocoprinus birnbaumii]|uniref:HAT C-terminal dimerisation domain-containing protein n=1 Tax=Leucocoprinus birnbaumii TaxID=56174 RepID=A0AAD5YWV0_9AGAR|nr:hypothetical protein NP233_g2975 [Leucocoprinus birnbaumii]